VLGRHTRHNAAEIGSAAMQALWSCHSAFTSDEHSSTPCGQSSFEFGSCAACGAPSEFSTYAGRALDDNFSSAHLLVVHPSESHNAAQRHWDSDCPWPMRCHCDCALWPGPRYGERAGAECFPVASNLKRRSAPPGPTETRARKSPVPVPPIPDLAGNRGGNPRFPIRPESGLGGFPDSLQIGNLKSGIPFV
jgi:hypothetical protein